MAVFNLFATAIHAKAHDAYTATSGSSGGAQSGGNSPAPESKPPTKPKKPAGLRAELERYVDAVVDGVVSRRGFAAALRVNDELRRQEQEVGRETKTAKSSTPTKKFFTGARSCKLNAARRVVAVGDLHGDIAKAREAFKVGGLVDETDSWCGGDSVAVQVGDQLDRGSSEVELLYWLRRLRVEARGAGGDVHVVTGNHEVMNVAGDFRYATRGALDEFSRAAKAFNAGEAFKTMVLGKTTTKNKSTHVDQKSRDADLSSSSSSSSSSLAMRMQNMDEQERARFEELRPGGRVTRKFLADQPTVLQIGSTVFVHGGVTPPHIRYGVDRINEEGRKWMLGERGDSMPSFYRGRDAVVWTREYSHNDKGRCECQQLEEVLGAMHARRMVVGHTIQDDGVNAACGERVFRVDVGLSKGCGDGEPEVLEILDDTQVRVLRKGKEPVVLSTGVCALPQAAAKAPPAPASSSKPRASSSSGSGFAPSSFLEGRRGAGRRGAPPSSSSPFACR